MPSESEKKHLQRHGVIFDRLAKLFETKGDQDLALLCEGMAEVSRGLAGDFVDSSPLDKKLGQRIDELLKQNRRRLYS